MNQTWHNSKHSRHSKVGNTYMAQSTPTHASGFHLVTMAMTGHAKEMGSTTAAHSSLKHCCLKCSKWEQEREHGIVSIWSMGLLAWQIGRHVLSFAWVLTVILRDRTYRREHRLHYQYQTICNNMMHACDTQKWVCWTNASTTRWVWAILNQRFKVQTHLWS